MRQQDRQRQRQDKNQPAPANGRNEEIDALLAELYKREQNGN